MALFGKKKQQAPEAPAPAAGVPTDRVIQLRQQGLSSNQIVETLQKEGFASSQIFDAMSQADIKGIVETPGEAPAPMPAPGAPAEMPPPQAEIPPPSAGMPPPPMPEMPAAPEAITRETIEEIAESIIDEKWEELMKGVDKILAWKEEVGKMMTKLEQEIKHLKASFEELHKGVLGKIGEYDKGIKSVGSDIKAMEGVFKKVLPTLTESVGELSRITKKIKKKK